MPRRTHPAKRSVRPQGNNPETSQRVTPTMLARDLVARGLASHIILEPSETAHSTPRRAA